MLFYDYLLLGSLPLGVVVGALSYNKLPFDAKLLTWFFVVTILLEMSADYFMIVQHKNNLIFYHIMTVIQYVLLSLYLRYNILFLRIKKAIIVSIFVVILIELILVFSVQAWDESPSWIRLLTRLLLLYWILFYLKSLLINERPNPLLSIPAFWVSVGVLVHFMSFLQVGLMRYMILTNRQMALSWYHFSIWFDVLFYLICTYSIYITIGQINKNK